MVVITTLNTIVSTATLTLEDILNGLSKVAIYWFDFGLFCVSSDCSVGVTI